MEKSNLNKYTPEDLIKVLQTHETQTRVIEKALSEQQRSEELKDELADLEPEFMAERSAIEHNEM